MSNQVAQYVTDRIIAQLEAGVVPWRKPWNAVPARNYVTGKEYRGVNTLLLDSGEYLTFNQVKALKGTVNKGAKTCMVVYYKQLLVESRDDKSKKVTIPLLRYYNVVALSDTTGIPSKVLPVVHEPVAEAEAIIAGYAGGPKVEHVNQDHASYSPQLDRVLMPIKEQFPSVAHYYSTFFHELVHSTGHKSRLDREMNCNFGSESYSKEELVAEIGAAMLATSCGIDTATIEASASYIKSWLSRLAEDPNLITRAAGAAQKAVDRVTGAAAAASVDEALAA